MRPGPPRSKTEHVFPVSIHTQNTYITTHLYTADHTDQHRCISSALKHKQHHRLIPFPSAADQDEDLSVGNLYVCAKCILPAAVIRHSF